MNTDKTQSEAENQPSCLGAVMRSFSYEAAKKIYIEGLAIGQLVERGELPNAEKFEEMLHRMNFVR